MATAEVLALSEALGDPVLASRALMLRFKAAVEVGDIDEAERCLARNAVLVADLGQPALAWSVMHQRAGLTLLRGDLVTAEAEILAAYEHAMATGQPDALPFSSAQQFSLRFDDVRRGRSRTERHHVWHESPPHRGGER